MDWDIQQTRLWENSRDAICHALEHLRELASTNENRKHHLKWTILSVHQAAECFCNIKLIKSNPDSLISKGKPWFLSLYKALKLMHESANLNLSAGEKILLHILKDLPDVRNRLMHRSIPEKLDSTIAAISLLGLIRIVRKQIGEPAAKFKFDSPRVEADVFSVIPAMKIEEYCRFSEHLLNEEYPDRLLGYCPLCETHSIVGSYCEICFEEMDSFECSYCGGEDFIPSRERYLDQDLQNKCSWCGKKYTT